MAIAYDNSSGTYTNSSNSITFAHTVGNGSDRIIFVAARGQEDISSVTYNGDALTLAVGDGSNLSIYYLVNPDSGANNVVVTCAGSGFIYASSASYTGAAQVDPINETTSGSGNPTTLTVTTTRGGCWLLGYFSSNYDIDGASGTLRNSQVNFYLYDSNSAISPAGSGSLTIYPDGGPASGSMVAFGPTDFWRDLGTNNTVNVTENVSVAITQLFSVHDSVSVSEGLDAAEVFPFSCNDNVVVTEDETLSVSMVISEFDSATVSDFFFVERRGRAHADAVNNIYRPRGTL
jgi:hypothetical protein